MDLMFKKSNSERLGTERIPRLLVRLSVPATLALIVSASYNLADTIFVGRLGVAAITALTIAFPLQMILAAIAQGTGVGTQSLISRLLGQGKKLEASHAAVNSLFLAFIYWSITAVIGIVFAEQMISMFSSDPQVISFGTAYIRIIFMGSFTLFYLRATLNILRAQGNYFLPMIILIFTAVINIVVDPILIYGMFGFPAFGVEGAAIATVGSRVIGCVVMSFIIFSRHNEVQFSLKGFRVNTEVISKVLSVGVPTMLVDLMLSISLAGTNKILDGVAMTTVLIAAVGIYIRFQSILLTPVLGLSRSLVPIIGYNYGAKQYQRIWQSMKLSLIFSFAISLIGFLIFELFPGQIISIFNTNPNLLEAGVIIFQRISIFFVIFGPALVVISFFQGIGRATKLFIILAIRQFFLFFPLLYALTHWFGHPLLWFAYPITDGIALVIGLILIYYDLQKLKISKVLPFIKFKPS